jgi:hypothetical protein
MEEAEYDPRAWIQILIGHEDQGKSSYFGSDSIEMLIPHSKAMGRVER